MLNRYLPQGDVSPGAAPLSDFSRLLRRLLSDGRLARDRQQVRAGFSPSLSFGRHFCPPFPTARRAAVMLLMETTADVGWQEWTIPLTVRSNYLSNHPGQISLPGGRLELGETVQQAAEREFDEELGFAAFPGQVIGELQSLYVYNSDHYVTPLIAVSSQRLVFSPCQQEVERIIRLPLRILVDERACHLASFSRGRESWTAPVIQFGQNQIWGATAIMLGELGAILKALPRAAAATAP